MSVPTAAIPIVIDTDIGADPDDALALTLALASPEVTLHGVTIVSGDVALRARIAARLLGMAGRPDIPVFTGEGTSRDRLHGVAMMGSEGQGLFDVPYDGPEAAVQDIPAVDWLLAASHQRPFHLIAIGPLTNVAQAIARDPAFARRLLGLTVMGGLLDVRTMPEAWQRDVEERGGAAWPDYNTVSDPAAALAVAQCGIPVTWVPLDVTMRAPLRAAARRQLPANRPLGVALGRMIDAWQAHWFAQNLPAGLDRGPVPLDAVALLHDPLTVAALLPRDWLRLKPARLRFGIEDGVFRLCEDAAGLPGWLAVDVAGSRFASFCMTRILRLITDLPAD